FVGTRFAIDGHPDIGVFFEAFFHGGRQCAFKCAKDHFARHIFFTREGVNQQKNFATHRFLPLKSRTGSSLARSTSSKVKFKTLTSADLPCGSSSSPNIGPAAVPCSPTSWEACSMPEKTLRLSMA